MGAGASISRESTSAPRGESEAKTSEEGVADECDQLRRELSALERKRAELKNKERELENIERNLENQKSTEGRKQRKRKRKLEVQLPPLRLEAEQMQENLLSKRKRLKDVCDAREAENAQRLELPLEVWEKIADELDDSDLFPLALSCRYFRQKQKELLLQKELLQLELVERSRQDGPWMGVSRRTLKTNLQQKLEKGQPASAEYLRFCSKERVSREVRDKRDNCIRRLAAFHGHLPLLQELIGPFGEDGLGWEFFEAADDAARGGQLETLQWLRPEIEDHLIKQEEDPEYYEETIPEIDLDLFNKHQSIAACEGGQWEIMEWLWSGGDIYDSAACMYAAAGNGHLETLKWLRSNGCPWDATACKGAAKGGHLEILKWLRNESCPWDESACTGAAQGGHLEVLKWLRSEGCPWNKWTCWHAAMNGHLDVLKWAIKSGCPYEVNPLYTKTAVESLGLALESL